MDTGRRTTDRFSNCSVCVVCCAVAGADVSNDQKHISLPLKWKGMAIKSGEWAKKHSTLKDHSWILAENDSITELTTAVHSCTAPHCHRTAVLIVFPALSLTLCCRRCVLGVGAQPHAEGWVNQFLAAQPILSTFVETSD
jgi:hypothetical protein